MKKLLKVGLDWDDTLCSFVKHAVSLCNEENQTSITEENITEWGSQTPVTKMVFPYYSDLRTYQMQTVSEETKEFVRQLQKIADVYIITAVIPQFMGIRAEQISNEFPDFPADHILMGASKNLIKMDILLDDAPHNILKASATYPVLIRRPWNRNLSGVLSVNTLEEFLVLVNQIMDQMTETKEVNEPCVYAIVGPSGAKKHQIARKIVNKKRDGTILHCTILHSICLDLPHCVVPEETITDTTYAGKHYTLDKQELISHLSSGNSVIVVVDICGAIALKREFPTVLIFCRQSRENMIQNVLTDFRLEVVGYDQATMQLLSMEQEIKNESLCDYSVRSDDEQSVNELLSIL